MKLIVCFALSMSCIAVVHAQTLQTPKNVSKLPAPKLTVLKPADIQITQVEFVRSELNPDSKLHKIYARVTIRNNGEMSSGAFQMQSYIENQLSSPQNGRKKFGSAVGVPAIAGGKSLVQEFVFTETERVVLANRVKLFLVGDFGNVIKESNESNNSSVGILIGL